MTAISDKKERVEALDTGAHIHVESPAGAGKTGLIVERLLALLAQVEHPGEILAMTFTRKAAAEMKERLISLLRIAAGQQGDSGDSLSVGDPYTRSLVERAKEVLKRYSGRQRELLLMGVDFQITTIHGFCLKVCRRAPLESGLEPGLRLMDENEQKRIQELAAREMLKELLTRPRGDTYRDALESRLLLHNMDTNGFISEVGSLLARRDQLEDLLTTVEATAGEESFLEAFNSNLRSLVESHLVALKRRIEESELGREWQALREYLTREDARCLDKFPEMCPGYGWESLPKWKELASILLTNEGKMRKRWGPKSGGFPYGFSKTEWYDHVSGLDDETVAYLFETQLLPLPAQYGDDLSAVFDLVLLVSAAIKKYRNICKARRIMDYVDLELGALKALGATNKITDSLLLWDRSIRHILIDEFQDTSSTEYKIVQLLVSGWETGDGRTVFLVGDPKQSIYRFRKADVSVFYSAEEGIERSGLDPIRPKSLKLKTNFRSSAALINWTNRVFGETIMSEPRAEYDEVCFIKAVPAPTAVVHSKRIELSLFVPRDETDHPRENEARYLAAKVLQCLENSEPEETIGILLFTRTHLNHYVEALREAGISFQIKEGLRLRDAVEVAHLANLATALARPYDTLAWVGALRAPWIQAPMSVIKILLESDGEVVFRKLQNMPSKSRSLEVFRKGIIRARARVGRDSLARVLRDLWSSLGGPEMVMGTMGLQGISNCLYFLKELEKVEQRSVEETLNEMEFLLDNLYTPVDPGAAESRVFLMTVHGAKGLEFDHCFVPWLDYSPFRSARTDLPAYLSLPVGNSSLLVSRPDRRARKDNTVYDLLYQIEKRKTLAEAKRLFYVAVTRAKKSLCLSGVYKRMGARNSPLSWLVRHFGLKELEHHPMDTVIGETWISVNPSCSFERRKATEKTPVSIPQVPEFLPEPLPYRVVTPSGVWHEGEKLNERGDDSESFVSRVRGLVIHQLIDEISRKGTLPQLGKIEGLFGIYGGAQKERRDVARDILVEIENCLQEPFFRWITGRGFEWSESEWSIEGVGEKGVLFSGRIDRIVFDGEYFWIVDFKTNRPAPGEEKDAFVARMKDAFSVQLEMYSLLVQKHKRCSEEKVKKGIYLTSVAEWVEI